MVSAITARYTADDSRTFGSGNPGTLEWHPVEPHGEWLAATDSAELVPAAPADAAFFIGLADASSTSQVSLLFHLAEGSGDPNETYPSISWEYLAGDTWRPFGIGDLPVETTLSLRRSGVIVFALPADATVDHSRMPAGLHWIRALATGAIQALNRAYDLTAQAAEATFVDQGNDLTRLGTPLPAGSVKRLVTANPAIKKVLQPLPSSLGYPAEAGLPFYRRISERLRHRQRASTLWDYERLVLEQFPSIHKVKCIPHSRPDSELAPGHVTLVVVPRLTSTSFDPERPAASQELTHRIKVYLKPRISPHVRLEVVNPTYDEVQVIARLAFREGYDQGFHLAQTAIDLDAFLAPWTRGDSESVAFGRELYPSSILNFLEKLEYVDFVTEFRARQFVAGVPLTPDPVVIEPSTERSILVPHRNHDLQLA